MASACPKGVWLFTTQEIRWNENDVGDSISRESPS